jgi:FdhD protein
MFDFYCLPKSLKELAVGYCYTHGILHNLSQMSSITIDEHDKTIHISKSKRPAGGLLPAKSRTVFSAYDVLKMRLQFDKGCELFRKTGSVHGCALADKEKICLFYEDVSRRNALEKVIGAMMIQRVPPEGKMLIFSGRLMADMVMSASISGIRFLVAPSATTAAAVDTAEREGVTLLAFVRGDVINVYTHPENIKE